MPLRLLGRCYRRNPGRRAPLVLKIFGPRNIQRIGMILQYLCLCLPFIPNCFGAGECVDLGQTPSECAAAEWAAYFIRVIYPSGGNYHEQKICAIGCSLCFRIYTMLASAESTAISALLREHQNLLLGARCLWRSLGVSRDVFRVVGYGSEILCSPKIGVREQRHFYKIPGRGVGAVLRSQVWREESETPAKDGSISLGLSEHRNY